MGLKVYYTVEKYTEYVNSIEECTGTKGITTYTVEGGEVKKFFDFELQNEDNTKDEINEYLGEKGYDADEVDLVLL